jgi:DNA-binding CsgD family transcriptional regulator/tetratricopeptide (TPR) repeat protein
MHSPNDRKYKAVHRKPWHHPIFNPWYLFFAVLGNNGLERQACCFSQRAKNLAKQCYVNNRHNKEFGMVDSKAKGASGEAWLDRSPENLLERGAVLALMRDMLVRARAGCGKTLLVTGEAGIGKSTLLEYFAKEQQESCRVLWGFCESLFTPRPLGPLVDIAPKLDQRVRHAIDTGENPAAIFAALLADLNASSLPSLLLFEDVHWADHATLDLIKFLGRRIAKIPALLVLTFRDDELQTGHPLLTVLGDLPGNQVQSVPLAPLSRSAVHTLQQRSGRILANLFEQTNGNPFYVTEVLASMDPSVPRTVQAAVLSRLQQLSAGARELCERVSVMPGQFELTLLSAFERRRPARAGSGFDSAIDECLKAGVLQLHGQALRFRHELARLAVHELLAPHRQRATYARVLESLLNDANAAPARLTYLAVLTGDADLILKYAPVAGADAARNGAHHEAAAHYAKALEHASGAALEVQAEINEMWSYEAGISLQIDQKVIAAGERAVALWRQVGNIERTGLNLRSLARLHWYIGQKTQADTFAAQAIEALESIAPTNELAMAYSVRSQMYMLSSNYESALVWGQRALALALARGCAEARIHALNNLGTTLLMAGQPGGEVMLQESLSLALSGKFHDHAARAYANLSSSLLLRCRLAEADRYCTEGIAFDREHDLDSSTYYLMGLHAQLCAMESRFAQAEALATTALAVPGQAPVLRWAPSLGLGITRSRCGGAGALALLQECVSISLSIAQPQIILPSCWALAEAHWLRGQTEEAKRAVLQGWSLRGEAQDPWLVGRLLVWGHRLGLDLGYGMPVAEIYQLEIDGHPLLAAAQWGSLGAAFEQGLCLMQCGGTHLLEAIDLFAGLGATAALELARAQARTLGIKGVKRGPYTAARENSAGLTSRELEIYQLLHLGLSNSEISSKLNRSVRTVEHHASRVLAKMGAKNRADLRAVQASNK